MEKNNFYQPQNKNFTWSEGNTNALLGAVSQIGSSYFNNQNQPGYQPPSPTYNVYQLPGTGSGSSNQSAASNPKNDSSKILGLDPSVLVVLVILIIAIIGALLYFKKPA